MLLTVIPYFKEVIVVSFRCEHCGELHLRENRSSRSFAAELTSSL